MLQFYHGPLSDLSPERILTDLGQLWCADPSKRRYLRMAGVDEAIVRGERGRYPFVLAYLDHLSGREEERAAQELAALRLAPGMLCYPEDLWDGAARRMDEGWQIAEQIAALNRASIEQSQEAAVGILLPLLSDLEEASADVEAGSLAIAADLSECYHAPEAVGEEDFAAGMARALDALEAFAEKGCRHAYLWLESGFVPCLRQKEEELNRIWRMAPRRRNEAERDALSCSMLFALLPKLRALDMTLMLHVGAAPMGDGFVDAGCDPKSIGEVASRLIASGAWPKTVLLPMSAQASMALKSLCGIFPAVQGAPAMAMHGGLRVIERGSVLSLLIR